MNPLVTKDPARPATQSTVTTTVAGYLLTRLTEAGIVSVFGVPGDYNLGLIDAVTNRPSMSWIGMASEQGAGYAADGYARQRGIGALITTFGVGELSAINAVAGAYTESVPLVHIVGTPALAARGAGLPLHHNLPGASYQHFANMAAEVTAAQADLRPGSAAAEIDRVITAALRQSRPVYITIPADVAGEHVPAPAAPLRIAHAKPDPAVRRAFASHAARLLRGADTAAVLIGHMPARFGLTAEVTALAAAADLPVAVLAMAKGDFAESDPRFAGLYAGAASAKSARLAVEDSEVLITVGVTLADTVTGGGTHQLPVAGRIDLGADQASIGPVSYPGVGLRPALALLTQVVAESGVRARPDIRLAAAGESAAASVASLAARDMHLSQQHVWASVQDFLRPGDVVVADQGTAFYGAAGLVLPDGARLVGQPVWASIGWALPAALGASFGAPDRRVVVIAGDGAMQQTAPELGTLLELGVAPVIIVLNNSGYAIERAIHNTSASYHRIPQWDWTALPAAMAAAASPLAIRAASPRKLDRALRAASRNAGQLTLIEAVLPADDAPPLLHDLARVLGARAVADG
jgi:indolepyruvate decarboxylase